MEMLLPRALTVEQLQERRLSVPSLQAGLQAATLVPGAHTVHVTLPSNNFLELIKESFF